jgi:hypothetical protein
MSTVAIPETFGKVSQFQDQKPPATQGGSTSNNTTYIRELNTDLINQIPGCVRSGNNITLLAGIYLFEAECPSKKSANTAAWIERVSGEAFDDIPGVAIEVSSSVNATDIATIKQIRTFTGAVEFCIKHFITSGQSTTGLGIAIPTGAGLTVNSVFTNIKITQLG